LTILKLYPLCEWHASLLHKHLKLRYNNNISLNESLLINRSSFRHTEGRLDVVSQDVEPVVHCEVLVPRIVFPTLAGQEAGYRAGAQMEQARVLPINLSPPTLSTPQSQSIQGEASTYTTPKGPFRLFRISNVSTLGKALLLQILRFKKNHPHEEHSRRARKNSDQFIVTDELAFTLEFSHSASEYTSTPLELIPGLNQITIIHSEEGIPDSYSIDGAES
jgi:hypothetical protein